MNIYHAPPCVDCPPTAFGGNVSSSSNGVSATQGCPQRRRYGKGMVGLRAAVHAHPQAVPHRTAGVSCLVCHSSPKAGTATNDVTDGTHRTSTRPVHVQDQQAGSYGRQAWGDDGNVQNVYQKDGWQRDVVSTEGAEGLSEPPSARFGVDNAMHQHATRLQHSRQSGRHHQTSTTAPQGGSNSRLTRSTWDTGRHCSKDIGKDESDRVLTHALCCCHSFSQVMEVLHSHHDSQEALAGGAQGADMSERTLFPQQQQQQQQQQQRTQLESPSASTARLLTHLNGRHLAVLWITLARVKEEQEWRRSHPGTTHHQHPQTPPALWLLQKQPSQQQQQQQQHVQQVQSVSSPAHSSHHPYSSSTQPISQQHNLRAMPRQSGSSSSSATLSRGELVELRRLVALLERATLGYMASGVGDGDGGSDGRGAAPVFGSMLKQGRAAGAAGGVDADRRQPVSGHGASAVQSNTNGSGAMQQREDAGKRGGGSMNSSISSSNSVTSTSRSIELWSFQDMANTISAMGRLGHVPSQRWLSCFVAASLPLLESAHPMHLAQAMSGLATLELPPGQAWMDAALARALQLTHQAAAAADTPTAGGKKQPASSAGPENSSLAGTPSVASSSSSSGSTAAVNGPDPALATDPRTPSPSETSSEHTSDGSKQPPVTSLTAAGYALILWSSARLHACSREGWSPLPGHASPQSKPLMHQSLGAHPATATAQTAPLSSSPPLTPMPSPVAVPLPWLASFLAASSAVCLLDSPDAEPQHASMVLWALGSLAMHGVAPQHTPQPSTTSIFTPSPSTSGHSLSSPSYSQSQPEVSLLLASAVPQQAQHQHQLPTLYPPNARPAGARTPGSLSTPSQHGQQHQHQHHQHQLQQQVALLGKQWNRGVDAVLECAARWGPALGPQGVANSLWGAARLHQHQQQQQQQQVQQQLWQPQITSWPPDALQDSASQQQQQQQQQWQQEQQHESSTVDAGAQRWGLQGNDWDTGAGGAALQEGQQQHRRQQQQVYYQQAQQQQQQQQSQLQFSWRRRHAPQLRALLHACEDVLPKMEPQHMANTAWAAAVLQPAPAPSPPWMQQLLHYLRPELYHLPPQGIATVLWACARMGCRPSIEWMLVLVRASTEQVSAFCPHSLPLLLWSLSQVGFSPGRTWARTVLGRSARLLPAFPPQSLATSLISLARLSLPPPSEWARAALEQMHQHMLHVLLENEVAQLQLQGRQRQGRLRQLQQRLAKQRALQQAQGQAHTLMKPLELSMCLQGLARLGVQPPRTFLETAERTVLAMLPPLRRPGADTHNEQVLAASSTTHQRQQLQEQLPDSHHYSQPHSRAPLVLDQQHHTRLHTPPRELDQHQTQQQQVSTQRGATEAHPRLDRELPIATAGFPHQRGAGGLRFVAGALYALARLGHDASDALLHRATLQLLQPLPPTQRAHSTAAGEAGGPPPRVHSSTGRWSTDLAQGLWSLAMLGHRPKPIELDGLAARVWDCMEAGGLAGAASPPSSSSSSSSSSGSSSSGSSSSSDGSSSSSRCGMTSRELAQAAWALLSLGWQPRDSSWVASLLRASYPLLPGASLLTTTTLLRVLVAVGGRCEVQPGAEVGTGARPQQGGERLDLRSDVSTADAADSPGASPACSSSSSSSSSSSGSSSSQSMSDQANSLQNDQPPHHDSQREHAHSSLEDDSHVRASQTRGDAPGCLIPLPWLNAAADVIENCATAAAVRPPALSSISSEGPTSPPLPQPPLNSSPSRPPPPSPSASASPLGPTPYRIVASRNAALSVPMGKKKRMKHLRAAQWAPRVRWLKAIDAGRAALATLGHPAYASGASWQRQEP